MTSFILNQQDINTALPKGMLLLDFIRYQQHLMGTKIGCREGDCGACTVLIGELAESGMNYRSVTSCLMPIGNAQGKHVVTIEGLNITGLNFLQQAFAEEGATQCGFCTPGFIVAAAGGCLKDQQLAASDLLDAVNGNICRCTGYKSIERAICKIAGKLDQRNGQSNIAFAVEQNILPRYFMDIPERMQSFGQGFISKPVASNGTPSTILGGGTDLYVQQHDVMLEKALSFVATNPALKGVWKHQQRCYMGASVTVTGMLESPVFQAHFPNLKKHLKLVSSTQIRNMATIVGNLVNASPIGDLTVFLLSLDAKLILRNDHAVREIPLRSFYKGYKSVDKSADEHIESIYFELPTPGALFNFEKVSKRTHLDIASVNSSLYLQMKGDEILGAGLAAGGVAPIPLYLAECSSWLVGNTISPSLVAALLNKLPAAIAPISDARGSKLYKTLLLQQLVLAHFVMLFPAMEAEFLKLMEP